MKKKFATDQMSLLDSPHSPLQSKFHFFIRQLVARFKVSSEDCQVDHLEKSWAGILRQVFLDLAYP